VLAAVAVSVVMLEGLVAVVPAAPGVARALAVKATTVAVPGAALRAAAAALEQSGVMVRAQPAAMAVPVPHHLSQDRR
jgi:hypothetical protein